MSKLIHMAAVVALAGALGGCFGENAQYLHRSDTIALDNGNAADANIATHTIDPWPPAAAKRRLTTNGELAQRAAERYRTNKTTPLKPIGTTSVQTSISPGAGASAGGTP